MSDQGCMPVEVLSLLGFRDHDLVVRCLELARRHIQDFAPECQAWDVRLIALCHHHPTNIYPAFGIYRADGASFEQIEGFGRKAEEWVRGRPFGWLLDESCKVDILEWSVLRGDGSPQ